MRKDKKAEITYAELKKARELLALPELFTVQEVKKAYREAIQQRHPDKNKSNNNAHWESLEIIHAYELIVEYCQNFKFSLKKSDFLKQSLSPSKTKNASESEYYDWWKEHYGDPLFGNPI